jgi:hypothetical protein
VANGYQTLSSRFHKPPCDPGQPDFPGPVLTLTYLRSPSCNARSLSADSHAPRCTTVYFQGRPHYVSRPYIVRVLMRLSGAQSPFAHSGCYPSCRGFANLVGRRYPAFIAHTSSCVNPKPSVCLEFNLEHTVFAGCGQPLLGIGPSRRYLCESFPTCLDPYPGCSCGALARFFPQDNGLPDVRTRSARSLWRPWHLPVQQFQYGAFFEAAVIR